MSRSRFKVLALSALIAAPLAATAQQAAVTEFLGTDAGFSASNSSDFVTYLGDYSGYSNRIADFSTAVGYMSQFGEVDRDTEVFNTTPPDSTLWMILDETSGNDNVAVGAFSMYDLDSGPDSVAIGARAGFNLVDSFNDNTLIGADAGLNLTTGSDNTYLGEFVGENATEASRNVYLGIALVSLPRRVRTTSAWVSRPYVKIILAGVKPMSGLKLANGQGVRGWSGEQPNKKLE